MEKKAKPPESEVFWPSFLATVKALFNLKADTDEDGTLEEVRQNVDFRSANAWTLVFAIIIASIGLNINSTAVIIGAMLISPLMAPIVGAGLALGINDFTLLKRSLRNMGLAVGISVLASAAYFLVSPLSEVQSELLARTRPTFYDVLIAIFGGAAGIIALSRKEKGNAIPGVAIATALMPPLCTAGFGLATGTPKYFFGAIYLFVINSVFICISTYVFVRYMGFRKVAYNLRSEQRRVDRYVAAVAFVVVVPSLVLAWFLQQEVSFRAKANEFISRELKFPHTFLVGRDISYDWREARITVEMIGETLGPEHIKELKGKLVKYDIPEEALDVRQTSLAENLERRLRERLTTDTKITRDLEAKLSQTEGKLKFLLEQREVSGKVSRELSSLIPKVTSVLVGPGAPTDSAPTEKKSSDLLVLWNLSPTRAERNRVEAFLMERVIPRPLKVIHSRALK